MGADRNRDYVSSRDRCFPAVLQTHQDGFVALSYVLFPVAIIIFQFYTIFTLKSGKHQPYIAIGIALEAFFESFFQLVLQIYTILYGYTITGKQIVAMCFSFFILSKASVDLDMEMFDRSVNITKTIGIYLQLVPGYAANICFRFVLDLIYCGELVAILDGCA